MLKQTEELQAITNDPPVRLALVRLRNRCLKLFCLLMDCTVSLRPDGPHALGFDTPTVQVQQTLFRCLNEFIQQTAALFPSDLPK